MASAWPVSVLIESGARHRFDLRCPGLDEKVRETFSLNLGQLCSVGRWHAISYRVRRRSLASGGLNLRLIVPRHLRSGEVAKTG